MVSSTIKELDELLESFHLLEEIKSNKTLSVLEYSFGKMAQLQESISEDFRSILDYGVLCLTSTTKPDDGRDQKSLDLTILG